MQHERSPSVVVYDVLFADGERLAMAGFLAGYRGSTRDAYALDLRQFVAWCADHRMKPFRAAQILEWVYQKKTADTALVSNLSSRDRQTLARYRKKSSFWFCDAK